MQNDNISSCDLLATLLRWSEMSCDDMPAAALCSTCSKGYASDDECEELESLEFSLFSSEYLFQIESSLISKVSLHNYNHITLRVKRLKFSKLTYFNPIIVILVLLQNITYFHGNTI